jgi:hypothetical protein
METTRHNVGREAVLAATRACHTHGLVAALALSALSAACRQERDSRSARLGATPPATVGAASSAADSTASNATKTAVVTVTPS